MIDKIAQGVLLLLLFAMIIWVVVAPMYILFRIEDIERTLLFIINGGKEDK